MIHLKNLSKKYTEASREIKIFKDLNLEIQDGTKNIILGTSGSGKSTFLNLISALDDPDDGSISINGINITDLDQTEKTIFRRENIGFIFQFFNLIPTLNVRDNILLPLELNNKNTKENQEEVFSLLKKVGLLDRLDSMPETLSGGEQQRIAIVRALAHKPKIIIADEPTGNLDKETTNTIITILNDLLKSSNSILIMATHNEKLIELADNVFEVKNRSLEKRLINN